ncbi:MAG: hypothetical protein WCK98_07310 [bacterium]
MILSKIKRFGWIAALLLVFLSFAASLVINSTIVEPVSAGEQAVFDSGLPTLVCGLSSRGEEKKVTLQPKGGYGVEGQLSLKRKCDNTKQVTAWNQTKINLTLQLGVARPKEYTLNSGSEQTFTYPHLRGGVTVKAYKLN